jgi:hypothetical protein
MAEMKFLLSTKKQTWRDKIRNQDIKQDLKVETLQEMLMKLRIRWYEWIRILLKLKKEGAE